MKIFKYTFNVTGRVEIEMPRGARILTVQTQSQPTIALKEYPCIWAIVDPDQPDELRRFAVFGTGHELDIDLGQARYIGTFQLQEGSFIGHLFELTGGGE